MDQQEFWVGEFAKDLAARGKLPATIASYSRDARNFIVYLTGFSLQLAHCQESYLVHYQEHLRSERGESQNTVRRAVIGVRQFFSFLCEHRHIAATPFLGVPIPARDESLPPRLQSHEVDALVEMALAQATPLKAGRDSALIALLAYEGLKASELITLQWRDYLPEATPGLATLRVRGPRARVIPLAPESTRLMHLHAQAHASLIGVQPPERIFAAFRGRENDLIPLPQLSRHGLKFILYELGEKVHHPKLNTEQLRHHATEFQLARGRNTEEIMQHFGLRRAGIIAKHRAEVSRTVST